MHARAWRPSLAHLRPVLAERAGRCHNGFRMTIASTENPLLLPVGTRLLHIGPPKTGTTALQYAFHATRRECREQGVRYAGITHQPAKAARAAMGIKDPLLGTPPSKMFWRFLLWEVRRASEKRVIISSESFARAPAEAIERIVTDLDPKRIHIVVTLRPLARILPSQWQQGVQNGLRESFVPWLEAVLDMPSSPEGSAFWLRHRHDALVARWAKAAGTENLTVVALDGRDHAMVLRVFEQLVGLREQTLPSIEDASNRSLTLDEARVVQAISERFRAERLDSSILKQLVTYGAAAHMKRLTPEPDEPKIALPRWAADRASVVDASMIEAIVASGVRVVGDPDGLLSIGTSTATRGIAPAQRPLEGSNDGSVPPRAAAAAAIGVVLMAGLARDTAGSPSPKAADDRDRRPAASASDLDLGSSLYILAVIANRARNRVAAWVHRARSLIGGRPRRPAGAIPDGGSGSPDRAG
jgi:hypothetical protein